MHLNVKDKNNYIFMKKKKRKLNFLTLIMLVINLAQ